MGGITPFLLGLRGRGNTDEEDFAKRKAELERKEANNTITEHEKLVLKKIIRDKQNKK